MTTQEKAYAITKLAQEKQNVMELASYLRSQCQVLGQVTITHKSRDAGWELTELSAFRDAIDDAENARIDTINQQMEDIFTDQPSSLPVV